MSFLLHQLRPANIAAELGRIRDKYLRKLRRVDQRVVTLEPTSSDGNVRGRVLLSYIIDPFLAGDSPELPHSHTHFWETWMIARAWRDLGYRVDAISWTNLSFELKHPYDVVIDVRLNLERLAPYLPGALKILHTDTSHYTFNNPAQEARRQALTERRGIVLKPQRMLPENRAAEHADAVVYLGNGFTGGTYAFACKPLFRVPVSVPFTYDWPAAKDFDAVRKNFLWFGSGGLVHKGLDLVLEAFAGLPDFHLTVCGPIRRERDFEKAYFQELYQTPNIRTLGWIDVNGPDFIALARQTLGLVYPSCAEGGGSSALTCMHAGIIPLLTPETSVDLDTSYGVELRDITVAGLREAIRELAAQPADKLETMARGAWEFARSQHSREHFETAYRDLAGRFSDGSWQT